MSPAERPRRRGGRPLVRCLGLALLAPPGLAAGDGGFLARSGAADGGAAAALPPPLQPPDLGGDRWLLSPPLGVLSYVHLWVDEDGGTHLKDCVVQNMTLKKLPGGSSEQYVRNFESTVSGLNATNVIVTQQVGPNSWHHCPQTQFVVTLSGTWFVNTTDGDQRYLPPGSWLYQDDSASHPAARPGTRRAMHYSEAVGPCNQMVLQWARAPAVGHVCPF